MRYYSANRMLLLALGAYLCGVVVTSVPSQGWPTFLLAGLIGGGFTSVALYLGKDKADL